MQAFYFTTKHPRIQQTKSSNYIRSVPSSDEQETIEITINTITYRILCGQKKYSPHLYCFLRQVNHFPGLIFDNAPVLNILFLKNFFLFKLIHKYNRQSILLVYATYFTFLEKELSYNNPSVCRLSCHFRVFIQPMQLLKCT